MFDVEQFKNGGTVIGNGCIFSGGDHLVHSSWTYFREAFTEGRFDDINDCLYRVDVGYDLPNALH
jgi:hypothetical protein